MHELRKRIRRLRLQYRIRKHRLCLVGNIITLSHALHEIGRGCLSAVCNRAHVPEERRRAHLVGILPDARPCNVSIVRLGKVNFAGCNRVALAGKASGEPQLFRVVLQGFRPKLRRELSEGHVARMRQCPGEIKASMYAVADDLLPADDRLAIALERARLHIRNGFERGGGRHELENGARRISCVKKAVQVHTFVAPCRVVCHVRHVVRVIARRRDRAEKLARFVIINADCPPVARKRLLRCGLHGRTDCKSRRNASGLIRVKPVYDVKAKHFRRVGFQ